MCIRDSYNINAYQHTAVPPSYQFNTYGWCLYFGFGGEDWTVDHNTCYAVGGYQPDAIQWEWSKQEGVNITSNMFVSIGPVSYTHLDVYKRQTQHRGTACIWRRIPRRHPGYPGAPILPGVSRLPTAPDSASLWGQPDLSLIHI